MRRAILFAVLLALCGCDDPRLRQDLAACRAKAVDALGPMPPPCPDNTPAVDYPTCKSKAADAITEYKNKHGPYVQDCMVAAGYQVHHDCIGKWLSVGTFSFCYERQSWLYRLGLGHRHRRYPKSHGWH